MKFGRVTWNASVSKKDIINGTPIGLTWSRKSYYSNRIHTNFGADLELQRGDFNRMLLSLAAVNSRIEPKLVTEIAIFPSKSRFCLFSPNSKRYLNVNVRNANKWMFLSLKYQTLSCKSKTDAESTKHQTTLCPDSQINCYKLRKPCHIWLKFYSCELENKSTRSGIFVWRNTQLWQFLAFKLHHWKYNCSNKAVSFMVWSIFFSNLFENDTDQFLFENINKLRRSIALFLSQKIIKIYNLIFPIENHGLFTV